MQSWLRHFSVAGSGATLLAAMGCASCFPALGALAGSLGLGFLAHYEGVLINHLLPWIAVAMMGLAVLAYVGHRRLGRLALSLAGPGMVLLTLYPLWQYAWSTWLFYLGLLITVLVAIYDMRSPSRRVCATTSNPEINP